MALIVALGGVVLPLLAGLFVELLMLPLKCEQQNPVHSPVHALFCLFRSQFLGV